MLLAILLSAVSPRSGVGARPQVGRTSSLSLSLSEQFEAEDGQEFIVFIAAVYLFNSLLVAGATNEIAF